MINIDISVGDQILVGRFKNKKIEVTDIGVDKHGGPTINGRSILKIRKMKSSNERREAVQYILDKMENNPLDERIERDEVHAETKKELKAAIARSMKEILAGKTPKYDIINGMTGEMIGWKDGKDYIWQPDAIPYAERELK